MSRRSFSRVHKSICSFRPSGDPEEMGGGWAQPSPAAKGMRPERSKLCVDFGFIVVLNY